MLRYFYIIVCVQVCFCSVYIDNNDYEVLDRRVRCKTTKVQNKPTRSPRKSRLVQFDVQKFMKGSDSQDDHPLYGYKSKRRPNRLITEDNAEFAEPHESGKSKMDGDNTRSHSDQFQNPRHFNFHSHAFDDEDKISHDYKKATSFKHKMKNGRIANNPEKKCSFRHMKLPFFSRNKATAKSKRHKKRKIFCFNCGKKTTTTPPMLGQTIDTSDVKTDDFSKDTPSLPNTDDKTNGVKLSKVSKRAYEQLCPKCIKELLVNLKKKTTKKLLQSSTPRPKTEKSTKKRTMKQKADLSDSFVEYYDVGNERLKRNEDEERERRLKELEEVEKKIDNVHVAAATVKSFVD